MSTEIPDECEGCGFDRAPIKGYRKQSTQPRDELMYLCDLCASTKSAAAVDFPRQFLENREVLATICYATNEILATIGPHRPGEVIDPSRVSTICYTTQDARRYEWLRQNWGRLVCTTDAGRWDGKTHGPRHVIGLQVSKGLDVVDPQSLDQAIDAAMEREADNRERGEQREQS
jgi:hypothetical protein